MRLILALCLVALPFAVTAQAPEDEAHRLDRLRTADLNERAGRIVSGRGDGDAARQHREALREYDAARAAYERRLADWRARVDACTAGYYAARGRH